MSTKKLNVGDQLNGYKVLPKEQRKTILFLGDSPIIPTGIGTMTKQLIHGMCHVFNFIHIGHNPGRNNQQNLQVFDDMSKVIQAQTGVPDVDVKYYYITTYGNQQIIRQALNNFKVDCLLHFTDPRSWYWLYDIENEIRQRIPICYYNIWDNLPYPQYNEKYYSCSDFIANISKQTQNIVKTVSRTIQREEWQTKYVPHGIDQNVYRPLGKNNKQLQIVKKQFGLQNKQFVMLFINRNIIRKKLADVIQAWQYFIYSLPEQQRQKCAFIIKSNALDVAGMPMMEWLNKVIIDTNLNIIIVDKFLDPSDLNILYNLADVTISASSAEGFGLSTAQSILSGTSIIAPVHGGMQDQMGIMTLDGKQMQLTEDHPSCCNDDFEKLIFGCWCIPMKVDASSSTGSNATPYIYDMFVSTKTICQAIIKAYKMGRNKLRDNGMLGRDWAINVGKLTVNNMCQLMIEGIQTTFNNWKPRKHFTFRKVKPLSPIKYSGKYDVLANKWR